MPKQSGNTTQRAELRPETKLVTLGEGEGGGGEWSNLAYLVSVILHRHTTVPSFLTSPRLLGYVKSDIHVRGWVHVKGIIEQYPSHPAGD